jgi:tetratricopeptide (TPR) repeat protein
VSTAVEVVNNLRKLKARSGLSYRGIERAARRLGDVLPASTVSSALNRDSLPGADFVRLFVRACGGSEDDTGSWIRALQIAAEQQSVRSTAVEVSTPPASGHVSPVIPCLLPSKPQRFMGRGSDSERACRTLTGPGPGIVMITGPAGVGKTTFAVHTAHTVKDHYGDGQLYAHLRGAHDDPADPPTVIGGFLRALGVAGAAIPADREERLHLYRTLTARRRVLVVLDDAADARQVRDLIPTGEGCAVIVTSRTSLADLDGSRHPLAVLSTDDAVELLANMAGAERVIADPAVARYIVERCDRLPLAVWIAGARLAARPHLTLADMASELLHTHCRLDALAVGEIALRTSLTMTYRGLSPTIRGLLRLLSIVPTDFGVWIAAALLDVSLDQAARHIDELVEVHLLETSSDHRFRMHDLVRAFAAERHFAEDESGGRAEAHGRMLGAALHLTVAGGVRLSADFHGPSGHPVAHWRLLDSDADRLLADVLGWFDSERRLLVLITEQGLCGPASRLAAGLATSLTSFLQVRCLFDDWLRLQEAALATAVASGDGQSAARLHRCLGELHTILDRYPAAITHFKQALAEGDADAGSVASSLAGLAYIYRLQGRYREATTLFSEAAQLARDCDNQNCLIYATNGAGTAAFERGDIAEARVRFEQSLELSRASAYLPGQAQALRGLAMLLRQAGELAEAAKNLEHARRISLELGDQLAAAHAACWLGDVIVRNGHTRSGRRLLVESLWTFREFGNVWGEAATLTLIADAELRSGNGRAALVRAKRAMAIWRRVASPYWLMSVLTTLGRAYAECGFRSEAARADAEAASLRSASAEDAGTSSHGAAIRAYN